MVGVVLVLVRVQRILGGNGDQVIEQLDVSPKVALVAVSGLVMLKFAELTRWLDVIA